MCRFGAASVIGHHGTVVGLAKAERVLRLLLIASGLLILSWAILVVLARRLPPGAAKDLATVLPARA